MRKLKIENKKGVSVIVAYVLLVVMGLSMSVLVYNWLKFQSNIGEEIKCPDEVSLVIEYLKYDCDADTVNVTLRNRGFFTFDGYMVRVNNLENADIGIYLLPQGQVEEEVEPSREFNILFEIPATINSKTIGDLTFIEFQPFIDDEKQGRVFCVNYASQKLSC